MEFFNDCIGLINDKNTLQESLTFIKRSDGKQAIDDGYHDDRIMSLAITNAVRSQQSYIVEKREEEETTVLPFALQDDTDNNNLDDEEEGFDWM